MTRAALDPDAPKAGLEPPLGPCLTCLGGRNPLPKTCSRMHGKGGGPSGWGGVPLLSPTLSGLPRQAQTRSGREQARGPAEQAHTGSPSCPISPEGRGGQLGSGGGTFLGRQARQAYVLPRQGVPPVGAVWHAGCGMLSGAPLPRPGNSVLQRSPGDERLPVPTQGGPFPGHSPPGPSVKCTHVTSPPHPLLLSPVRPTLVPLAFVGPPG